MQMAFHRPVETKPTFHWTVQLFVYVGNEDGLSRWGRVAGKKELSLAEQKAEGQFSSHFCTLSWRQSLGMGRFILKRAGRLHLFCFQTVEYETILTICIQLPSSPFSCCSRSRYIPSKNNVSSCQIWVERGGEDKTWKQLKCLFLIVSGSSQRF